MAVTIFENMITLGLFILVFTCIISFASAIHEKFMGWRRRGRGRTTMGNIASPSVSAPTWVGENALVRGYDSEELFREDLWLLRIAQSRRQAALPQALLPSAGASLAVRREHLSRVFAMLAYHANVRCDN
jgi:hypothetical protein